MAKKTEGLLPRTSNQKKSVIMSLTHNPWLVGIGGGIVVGLIFWYFLQYKPEKTAKVALIARINSADELSKKNMTDDALATYQDVLKTLSVRKYPEIYAHLKNNQGICYYQLARIRHKEENLIRAIRAYEEALTIYTFKKYPDDYAAAQNNHGNAYTALAEVRNKEENLSKAIRAYEEALKIYTIEKYPVYYKIIMLNMERTIQKTESEQ